MIPKANSDTLFNTATMVHRTKEEEMMIECGGIDGDGPTVGTTKNNAKKMEEEKPDNKELEETMHISKLMAAFKRAKEAMVCFFRAAYQCSAFVRFLDKVEKRQYKKYKSEQEEEDSEEE